MVFRVRRALPNQHALKTSVQISELLLETQKLYLSLSLLMLRIRMPECFFSAKGVDRGFNPKARNQSTKEEWPKIAEASDRRKVSMATLNLCDEGAPKSPHELTTHPPPHRILQLPSIFCSPQKKDARRSQHTWAQAAELHDLVGADGVVIQGSNTDV